MTDTLPDGKSVAIDAPIEREKMNLVHARNFDNQWTSPVPMANRHQAVTFAAEAPEAIAIAALKPEGATRLDVQCLSDMFFRWDGDVVKVMAGDGFTLPAKYICQFMNESLDTLVFGPPSGAGALIVQLYFY